MKTRLLGFLAFLPLLAFAQGQRDPAPVIAAQVEAMKVFASMDGVWRGPAWTLLPNGEKRNITQTERIGPFLGGSVKVIEGRGYTADGYAWEVPAGPATIRYVATIKDGTLREVGDRVVADKPPFRIFEMELKRVGDTSWPAGAPVPAN